MPLLVRMCRISCTSCLPFLSDRLTPATHGQRWQISDVIASYYLFLMTFLRMVPHIRKQTHRRSRPENEGRFPFDFRSEKELRRILDERCHWIFNGNREGRSRCG